jgi:hypothetical protein
MLETAQNTGAGRDTGASRGVVESTIWVAKMPHLRTTLDICNTVQADLPGVSHIEVWSSAGELVNQLSLQFKAPGANKSPNMACLDLNLLVPDDLAKTSGSLVHGTVYVRSPKSYVHSFRLTGPSESQFFRGCHKVSRTAPFFSFIPDVSSGTTYFGLMNESDEQMEVQCRLYFDRFYREVLKVIPARGARIARIEEEFAEVIAAEEEKPQYLRISQKRDREGLLVQALDCQHDSTGQPRYVSYS